MRKRIREQARKDGCVCEREREERERERERERESRPRFRLTQLHYLFTPEV